MQLSAAAVLGLGLPAALAASGTGQSTRYWDCCKPSCSWPGKAAVDAPVGSCDRGNYPLANANAASGCGGGGTAFACAKNSPFAVTDALAYGFAATSIAGGSESSWCCACYALSFTSGPLASHNKTMIVQSTNTGGDLGSNQFDLMIPGGGVGAFAGGCAAQYGVSLPGAQYGGVSSRAQCAGMPSALQAGCYWRFDWFMGADNPSFRFKQVRCPDQLVGITGCRRHDDGQFPVWG